MLAGCGGFIAALGIAFTAVATSPFALAFTLGGLALASVAMHVEAGQLLGQSVENIGKASHESAIRRQKAKKLGPAVFRDPDKVGDYVRHRCFRSCQIRY